METLKTIEGITAIELFTDQYENDENVFFHGTNSFYSQHIEKYGLIPNHKALSNYYYTIQDLADKILLFTQNETQFSEFNEIVRNSAAYIKSFTRISFSAVSLCAAKYSFGETAGGQGLRHLRKIINILSKLDYSLIKDAVLQVSDSEKYHFTTVQKLIEKLLKSDGVVYAIRFEENDIPSLYYNKHVGHSVLLTNKHVIPERIVAKMLIPNTTVFNPDLVKTANEKTDRLIIPAYSTSFLRKVIQINADRIDIDVLKRKIKK